MAPLRALQYPLLIRKITHQANSNPLNPHNKMTPSILLLGPPEMYRPTKPSPVVSKPEETIIDSFMSLMVANFNKVATLKLPMGYTENRSPTYLSTGNPCLDFFFHVVPDTNSTTLTDFLNKAWEHNPLTTLKLIANLRGVRGTGKSDKEGYYTSALWLHKHHPKTLACNVGPLAGFGCYKDLPEILYRLLEGPDVRKIQKEDWMKRKGVKISRKYPSFGQPRRSNHKKKPRRNEEDREARVLADKKRGEIQKEEARKIREKKKIFMAKKVCERVKRDPDYRFLYQSISDHFADCLKSDMEFLKSQKLRKITLAAKWCPSLDSSFDRSTLLCESIARKVFPITSYPEYDQIEDAHYAYCVRDRLRKQVLVPLRKALELPEVYIGANDWGSIPYNRVASVAMTLYKEKFLKYDNERFQEYLEKVKSGNAKIAAGALLPHDIIASLEDYDGGQVAELQWKRIVQDLSTKGKLSNSIAISDVSGSMYDKPLNVSIALGLLISELSEEPWKGKLITFSANPELQYVEEDDLRSKTNFVRDMEWGMNTDFQKVFDLILQVAVDGKLKEDEMIKRVFVFSDMEFDEASANRWETDYQAIVRKFGEKGYGTCVPEIVFWNLRDSRATPVPGDQKGVALVSGFSKNLIKIFLENGGFVNPEDVMEAAISGKEYKKLVVVD